MGDQNKNLGSRPLGLSMSYTWNAFHPYLCFWLKNGKQPCFTIKWTVAEFLALFSKSEPIALDSGEW